MVQKLTEEKYKRLVVGLHPTEAGDNQHNLLLPLSPGKWHRSNSLSLSASSFQSVFFLCSSQLASESWNFPWKSAGINAPRLRLQIRRAAWRSIKCQRAHTKGMVPLARHDRTRVTQQVLSCRVDTRRLHSADTRMLLVTRTNFGDRACCAAGLRVREQSAEGLQTAGLVIQSFFTVDEVVFI